MTPTVDLCRVEDAGNGVRDGESHQSGSPVPTRSLTLYGMVDDLMQLLAVREDMADSEDHTEIEQAIAHYVAALPEKVDNVAHVLRHMESQEALAKSEIARLTDRKHYFASMRERLKGYCCDVLAKLPKPKRGSRKLEGATASLSLVGNGGLAKLDITEPSIVPDEYCVATVTMPYAQWLELVSCDAPGLADGAKVTREISNAAIREALDATCWLCEGKGGDCSSCGGSGKQGVPGARLLETGSHLEIR